MSDDSGEDRDADLGMIEQQIINWVREHVAFPNRKLHGPCNKVVLKHLNVNRRPQGDVTSFNVQFEEGSAEDELPAILHRISEAAQQDADDLQQGVQMYALYAYYSQDRGYVPRKSFRVAAADVEVDRDLSPSEAPNANGLVAQTMRHLESVMKTAAIGSGYLIQSIQAENKRQADMIRGFMTQQVDLMVLLQDVADRSHERRLKEKDAELSAEMKANAMSKLDAVLPVVINRLAGTKILPEEDHSLMLMASLLENINPEQQAAILATLNDAQRLALAEIVRTYEEKKSGWMEGQKKLIANLATSNAAPTSAPPSQDAPRSTPVPSVMSITDRLKLPPTPSSDPQITKIEDQVKQFAATFQHMIARPAQPPKKE